MNSASHNFPHHLGVLRERMLSLRVRLIDLGLR